MTTADHESARAAGAWHAQWQAMSEMLTTAGGAAARLRDSLRGLRIHPDAMLADLDVTGGLLLAERVVVALGEHVDDARTIVTDAARHHRRLDADPAITAHLSPARLAELLDPSGYTGHAGDLTDRGVAEVEEILAALTPMHAASEGADHAHR